MRLGHATTSSIATRAARAAATLGVVLGLAACAGGMHWEHPQFGQQNLAKDAAECRRLAAAEAWRAAPLFPFRYRHGRYGFWWNDPFYDHDRFWREARLRDYCLRSRGYTLVPDVPAG